MNDKIKVIEEKLAEISECMYIIHKCLEEMKSDERMQGEISN